MILDNLHNAPAYFALGDRLARGLVFLQETDLSSLSIGRHDIAGDDCFALVSEYDTKAIEEGKWEAHRKYIDIQCLASGREMIGCSELNSLAETEDYDEARDVLFLEGSGEYFTLRHEVFVVLFPWDAHMPCVHADGKARVKKVVVKVRA